MFHIIYTTSFSILNTSFLNPDINTRIDKAFRNVLRSQEDKYLFESYIRGGIDKMNEKIFLNEALHEDEYMDNILEFIKDTRDKFTI